jgi:actin related protein 2/3 complex subunit 3
MPSYHSHFGDDADKFPIISKVPLLPLKTKFKGPAASAKADEKDIIDEAIFYFRANVLFQSYEVNNPADVGLVQCTLYIQQIIAMLKKYDSKSAAEKQIGKILHDNATLPSDKSHPLRNLCPKAKDSKSAEKLRNYLTQMRKETLTRMLDILYAEDGAPNKWWFQFHKMKFMGMALPTN